MVYLVRMQVLMLAMKHSVSKQDLNIDALIDGAQEASGFLKALAHEARLLILCQLIEEEKSVTEIEEFLSLRQPAVSQQLARLRAEGLVATRRDGKNIYYSLARPEVRGVIAALYQAFCQEPRLRMRPLKEPAAARATSQAASVRVKLRTSRPNRRSTSRPR